MCKTVNVLCSNVMHKRSLQLLDYCMICINASLLSSGYIVIYLRHVKGSGIFWLRGYTLP